MAAEYQSPVFLLTFANERPQSARYLRNLAQELSRLRATLEQPNARYQLVFYPNMTIEELLRALRTYRNRIALLHYGGHSNSYSLLLQSADGQPTVAHSGGLAKLLAQQHGLYLVFLNGCANEAQAQALLDAGVAVVVATSDLIEDQVAMHFADHFYAELAANATIAEAFDQAAAAVELQYGTDDRNLYPADSDVVTLDTPWQLYARDEAAVGRRLADLSNDPYWGLPPLPRLDLPAQPFRHLAWFRAAHAEIFFGRGWQIRELYQRITDPDGAPLLLLYGQSGVGKSSLLEAGLLPRLATEYMSYYVRRDRTLGLTQSLAAALCARTTNRTISAAWQDHERMEQKPLIVILDQVEEIFTRPQLLNGAEPSPVSTEMADFLCTLRQLFSDHNQRPQGKLILGFRKEYLAEIEKRLSDADLPYSKLFLEPLSKRGIIEAITGVTRNPRLQTQYGLTVEDGLPALIAENLRQDGNAPIAPTLQILLAKLWERATAANQSQPRFDQKLYRALQQNGILLSDFFEQSLQAIATVDAEAVNSGLLLDLLAYHTTPWGTADQHSRDELTKRYPQMTPERLMGLIQACNDHYLLTDPADNQAQPVGVPAASRLAHDALAPLVRERFARSEAPGQRARRLLESCVSEWRHDPQTTRLDDNELALVEQNQVHMRVWTDDERALVKASQEARTVRQQQAEQQQVTQRRQRQLRHLLLTLIGITLLVIGVQSLGRQKLADDNLRQESVQWSAQAKNQSQVDPIASIILSIAALPSAKQPRPYVLEAEFNLWQALNSSLERVYQSVGPTPLSTPQVAVSRDWIAVGGPGLRLIPYNLSSVITVTGETTSSISSPINAVAWNSTQDTLLSQEDQTLRLWQGERQVAIATLTAPIGCIAWRPTEAQLDVCTGKDVALWRVHDQQPSTLFQFTEQARAAQWSPDGRWLVAWDAPYTATQQLLLWDSQSQQMVVQTEEKPKVQIRAAAWAPDSQHLVISSSDGRLQIQRMGVATKVTISHEHAIAQLQFISQSRFLTWGSQDVVRLWSTTGTLLQTFGNAEDNLQGFRVSPDQTELLVLERDGTAWRYDLTHAVPPSKFEGHDRTILTVAWHPNGQYIATGAMDGTARVWERATGKLLMTLHGHTGSDFAGRADVLGVQWRPDDRLLTYGEDGSFRLWAIFDQQGLPLCVGDDLDGQPRCHATAQSYTQTLPLLSAHWLDNDTIITVDEASTVQRLTRDTGNSVTICEGADEYTAMARVATAAQHLLFYDPEKGGRVCDLRAGQLITYIDGPITGVQWIGEWLLISRQVGGTQVIDAASGAVITTLQGVTTTVAAAVNGSGQLATATTAGVIHIWTLPSGTLATTLGGDLPADQRGELTALTWSGDDKQLLATGTVVRLWQVAEETTTMLTPRQSLPWDEAQLSVDQQWVAVSKEQQILIKHASDGSKQEQYTHADTIQGMAWFTGVRWPHESRYPPRVAQLVRWLTGGPWSVSSTRQLLLTWSGDGTARIWDVEHGTELMQMADSGRITLAAISPKGDQLFTVNEPIPGEHDSTVLRIWPLWQQTPDALLAAAQKSVTHPLTAAQAAAFSLPTP